MGGEAEAGAPPAGPLARFTVLELTVARAGPAAARHLADWGANVIRIEPPASAGGSEEDVVGRRFGPDRLNLLRNRKSLGLNLKTPEGLAIFMELVKRADVVIENMRSNVKHRLGIDYETLRKVNPRIVYGSISGFGQTGPYKDRAGVDQILQGMAGLMSITGLPGQGPVRVGIPIVDLTAGGFLAQGILIALLEREVTGVGRWVHTSLLESMIAMLDFQAVRWLMAGEVAKQAGNNHPIAAPTGLYPAADGQILLAATGHRLWTRFCEAVGRTEWLTDPRYATSDARYTHCAALDADISALTVTETSQHWFDLLSGAGIPCGPVNTIDKVFADAQVQHVDMVMRGDHPSLGAMSLLAQPNNIEGHGKRHLRIPPAALGQHTDEIMRGLGFSDGRIGELRKQAVI